MQRKVLNPVFSVKHMRNLLPIFTPISEKLCTVLETKIALGQSEIDVYGWAGRTALEFIAQGGLGTSLDSLVDGEESSHSALVKEMVYVFVLLQFLRNYSDVFVWTMKPDSIPSARSHATSSTFLSTLSFNPVLYSKSWDQIFAFPLRMHFSYPFFLLLIIPIF